MEGDELHMKTAPFYKKKSHTFRACAEAREHFDLFKSTRAFQIPRAFFKLGSLAELWLGPGAR